VTVASGLDYEHDVGDPAGDPLLVSGGVAAGDFDRDGYTDLYVVRALAGPNLLFRNQAGSGFAEVGDSAGVAVDGEYGCGPTFADVDGDGWLDLLVGGVAGTTPRLFRNLGPQPPGGQVEFAEVTAASGIFSTLGTISAGFGDFDRDGDLDLFLSHWSIGPGDPIGAPHLWRNDGSGVFSPTDFSAGIAAVYQNRDWSFAPTFTDFDDDGWPDLLVSGDFGSSQVFKNRGDGTFAVATTAVISDENGMGSAVGDVDNDGDLDWFVSSIWDPDGHAEGNWGITGNRLYRNTGQWQGTDFGFEDATDEAGVRQGYWGWGSCFADFDNDGWLDLFHVNGFQAPPADEFFADPARLFVNDGDGTFTERAAELGVDDTGQGRGVVCFDYDRDGDLDLFLANNSGPPRLLRNDGLEDRRFLQLRLHGEGGNREAIGARVTVIAGGLTQTREIRAGSNYVSQNPAEAHFGLGAAAAVDEVRIRWPEGDETVLEDVAADQLLDVDRGGPILPPAVEIPALGSAGKLVLALLAAGAGWRSVQRRRS
jgi:hypothetical protein